MEIKPQEALTFDDVLIAPNYSELLPAELDLTVDMGRDIVLKTPFFSAAMDTVTESQTAIAMAQEGGVGVIHRNMSAADQCLEVEKVKKFESGMIANPVTTTAETTIAELLKMLETINISGVPVLEGPQLVGIVTSRDLRYVTDTSLKVSDVMTKKVITAPTGIAMAEAKEILHKHRIEKLPVVDEKGQMIGLITSKDIDKSIRHPDAAKDKQGRLLCAAAIGVKEEDRERAEALIEKGVDLLALDLAHGHSKRLIDFLKDLRKAHKDIAIIAGNIATADAVDALAKAGADIVKVGIGAGSICTTRIVAGCGVPQLTAIMECSKQAEKSGVTTIADGGLKYSGDVVKALAAGGHAAMIGSLLAGTDESPGDLVLFQGRTYKTYRGMGSMGAIRQGDMGRYFPPAGVVGIADPIPEGIEGRVPYRGSLKSNIHQLAGGLRSGMAYAGAKTLADLRKKARFVRITNASLRESHVHDVIITKEAPNYRPSTS